MAHGNPRHHHYVPQFYLRLFSRDPGKTRVNTVSRNGDFAVFANRSIENIGFERDFYVHMRHGAPINVEPWINRSVETPLTRSDTWRKISSGLAHQLDRADKGVIYALIRHLQGRNPHALEISKELAQLAADPNCDIPFTDEERGMYAEFRRNPQKLRTFMNFRSTSAPWTERDFHQSALHILRSPIELRTSTMPVMSLSAPQHAALHLPLPGQTPYMYVLTLDRTTLATLAFGDFDGEFGVSDMPLEAALMFNRHYVGHFAKYKHVRHLIADDDRLVADMTWISYDLLERRHDHMKFKCRPSSDSQADQESSHA